MTAALAIGTIDLYQRFISPYKGFRCAHRAVHGRCSCSQFAKRLIGKVGLLRFGPLFMRRLRKCGDVARALKAGIVARAAKVRDNAYARRDNRSRSANDGRRPDVGNCNGCDVPDFSNLGGCDAAAAPVEGCDCGGGCDLSL